ncbi:MAG TPA: glycosyltransferase family 4 protein [Alphaproteobacteria bacterium]|nr:glycosyltransferase family 4 protein [Alphaproteobacteria bacterium]
MRFDPPIRLAYLVSHPIQYQAPLLRRIAEEADIDLTVLFCSDVSVRAFHNTGFGRVLQWDVPLLDGYRHRFLPVWGPRDRVGVWRPLTYGVGRILDESRVEALWVHSYARLSNLTSMLAARRRKIPVLLREEMSAISAQRSAMRRGLKKLAMAGLDRLVGAYLAIGTANSDYYRAHGIDATRIFSVPYAVDNERFRRAAEQARPERARRKAELNMPPDRPVAAMVARLIESKAPADLLAAWRIFTEALPPERRPSLVFVGDGPLLAELERAAAGLDTIRFAGFRNQTELPAFYAMADLLVLPSRREPWGLVVNEAMNAGCAILASDRVGAALDLVRDGVNGMVFPAGSVPALASSLERLFAEPSRLAEMGRQSLRMIERWGFEEDVTGLRAALAAIVKR